MKARGNQSILFKVSKETQTHQGGIMYPNTLILHKRTGNGETRSHGSGQGLVISTPALQKVQGFSWNEK